MTFWADLVANLRKEQGVSQRALAQAAGVSRSCVRNIESGAVYGTVGALEKVLGVFGYELDAMKTEEPTLTGPPSLSSDTKERK